LDPHPYPAPQPPAPVNGSPTISFGGPARLTRDAGESDELRYAVIPLPAYPYPGRTLERRQQAISVSYTGRWEDAVDLYRGTVEEDGFFCGILDTMAHGILGLPLSFQGDPSQVSALLDADGTSGDFATMHPAEECAKIFRDGLGLGLGLGQYLLTCWRCCYTDLDRVGTPPNVVEVCKRCRARRIDRPAGQRELFALQWRDPRWLWQNPISFQWYYTGASGMVPIVDGDGEWFMFRTVPGLEPWRHGPWIWATLAAIFSRDSQYDAQNTSAVCAPTPVLQATKPVSASTYAEAQERIKKLAHDNRMVLKGEWDYKIVSAAPNYIDVCASIVERCSDAFETGITGNVMGRSARSAFTDAGVYKRTTSERRAFYGNACWSRQIRDKGLVWWGLDNFGTRNVPVGEYDVESPEDKLSKSKALSETGDALTKLRAGLDAMGLEADPEWAIELLQRAKIRARVKPVAQNVAGLDLGVEAKAAVVRGGPALASLGLAPFGDERDDMTIVQLENLGKSAATGPGPSAPSSGPTPPALPEAPAPAAPIEGRAAVDEELGDPADHADAARFAAEMTAAGADRCPHGRTHACPRCGIRRVYSAAKGADGAPAFGIAWRSMIPAPAQGAT